MYLRIAAMEAEQLPPAAIDMAGGMSENTRLSKRELIW